MWKCSVDWEPLHHPLKTLIPNHWEWTVVPDTLHPAILSCVIIIYLSWSDPATVPWASSNLATFWKAVPLSGPHPVINTHPPFVSSLKEIRDTWPPINKSVRGAGELGLFSGVLMSSVNYVEQERCATGEAPASLYMNVNNWPVGRVLNWRSSERNSWINTIPLNCRGRFRREGSLPLYLLTTWELPGVA